MVRSNLHTQGVFAGRIAIRPLRVDRIDKSKLVCTHCNGKGHDHTTCFKIYGYPDCYEEMRARRAMTGPSERSVTTSMSPTVRSSAPVKAHAVLGPATSSPSLSTPVSTSLAELRPDQV